MAPLLLLGLAAAPAQPPTELALLHFSSAFAAAHPCKEAAPAGGQQFCLERARVVFYGRQNALIFKLEVFDAETGAKLHDLSILGGVGTQGGNIYFHNNGKLQALSLKNPADKPKVLGPCDCGTEASPYVFAVANDQPLCVQDPEFSDGATVNLDLYSGRPQTKGSCEVPPADFRKNDMGYTLVTDHLSGVCLRLLGVKLKK